MDFNPSRPHIMHIDLNSCFATIEQQANPNLRGKPVVVAAYVSPNGCILAASIEAKRLGIKTGMRVRDGKNIYQNLIVLPSDPPKYRDIHLKMRKILSDYTDDLHPKSIDEFVLNLENYLTLKEPPLTVVAQEIKKRIKTEIGEWLTVSIGIAPNRYLAKIGAGIKKPDGLDIIDKNNFWGVYAKLKLTDLTGIKSANEARLNSVGIYTVRDFYHAPVWKLKAAFHSITGLYWHTRLSGYEVDDFNSERKTYGNSVALGKKITTVEELSPILTRLTEKMCTRFRTAGYKASGIHLAIGYKNGQYWHKGMALNKSLFDSRDVYMEATRLLLMSPSGRSGLGVMPVLNLAVSVFGLTKNNSLQLGFFEDVEGKNRLTKAIDTTNAKWGEFTVTSAKTFKSENVVMDRISFACLRSQGGVRELAPTP